MSGHNKWSQIKRQKGKTDAQKSKTFSKYAKLISVEAKKASGNRESPGLKAIIDRAKAENMPNDNIERAIKKATDNSAVMENITYEAYGPGGCAMIIEALTENRNKAAQEIKFILGKFNFALAGMGAAAWAFSKQLTTDNKQLTTGGWKPTTTCPISDEDAEKLGKLVEELEENDEVQEVFTNAE